MKKWKYLAENKLTVDQLPESQLDDKLAIEYSEKLSIENKKSEGDDKHSQSEDEVKLKEEGSVKNDENKSESSIVVHSDNDNLTDLSHE